MPINIADAQKDSLETQGVLTNETTLSGDLSGTLPDPTVTAIQGNIVASGNLAAGQGYRSNGTNLVAASLLDENSAFSGDVSGSQVGGITVSGLDGNPVEISTPSPGQVLTYNGTTFVNSAAVSGGLSIVTASANRTAANNEYIVADSSAAAFNITCPTAPTAGNRFIVVDSTGSFATNNVTLTPETGGSFLGGTVNDTLILSLNNAYMEVVYNGTSWNYFLLASRS